MLDVGATIGADADQLVDFAIMGEAMARCLFGIERPTVGLLNIGVEEIKGIEQVKEAGRLLRELRLPIEYIGFVEGDDIGKGTVDVVVTEGFTGNIALKTAEGTARQLTSYLKQALNRSLFTRIGAIWLAGRFRGGAGARWTRGRAMAACSSASTASWSRAMAAPTLSALPRQSTSPSTWCENRIVEKIAADMAVKSTAAAGFGRRSRGRALR